MNVSANDQYPFIRQCQRPYQSDDINQIEIMIVHENLCEQYFFILIKTTNNLFSESFFLSSIYSVVLSIFLDRSLSFCVLKKWVHSRIGQYVRPSLYTMTLHNSIRLNWNFVHRIVSSISGSSSKMRRIRQEMAELSKKLSLLTRTIPEGGTGIFSKNFFSQHI